MWALLVIIGFMTFAVGVTWFAWTVVKRRPIEQFPGGAGLLALALLGLLVLLIGIGVMPGPAPQAAPESDGDAELRAELAETRAQLGAVRRDVDAVRARLEEVEEAASGLAESVAWLEALERAEAPVVVDGPVTALSNGDVDAVDRLVFGIRNRSRVVAFPLTASSTHVSYSDEDLGVGVLDFHEEAPSEAANGWSVRWTEGEGPNLGPGEVAEITISLLGLDPRLTAGKQFVIEVELPGQLPIEMVRATPPELAPVMELGP